MNRLQRFAFGLLLALEALCAGALLYHWLGWWCEFLAVPLGLLVGVVYDFVTRRA